MASLPPTWFEVELWSASCVERWSNTRPSYIWSDGVSRSPNNLPTKIQSRSSNKDALPTKIQRSVDRTEYLHIFSLTLSKQRYRGTWMEHAIHIFSTPSQQKQRQQHCVSNTRPWYIHFEALLIKIQRSVDWTHDLHIFSLTIHRRQHCGSIWAHLETMGKIANFEIRL